MRAWLDELNLGRHAGKFEQYDIDPDTHMALTDRHLQEMGINSEDRYNVIPALPISLSLRRFMRACAFG